MREGEGSRYTLDRRLRPEGYLQFSKVSGCYLDVLRYPPQGGMGLRYLYPPFCSLSLDTTIFCIIGTEKTN